MSRVNGNQYMITLQFLIEKKTMRQRIITLVITPCVIKLFTQFTPFETTLHLTLKPSKFVSFTC